MPLYQEKDRQLTSKVIQSMIQRDSWRILRNVLCYPKVKDISTFPLPLSSRYQRSGSAFKRLILLLLLSFAVSSIWVCIGRKFEPSELWDVEIFWFSRFRCLELIGTGTGTRYRCGVVMCVVGLEIDDIAEKTLKSRVTSVRFRRWAS